MGKIRNPVRFSTLFNISQDYLEQAGALDPTLNLDTNLFIDPLLLEKSQHPEIYKEGYGAYNNHFGNVISLLSASKNINDTAWRNARRQMSFPEIKQTCLGYGANSVAGSGSGNSITDFVMQTAKDVVELGINDPNLFIALAIFEGGIGPDRISDMATNVIIKELIDFTNKVLAPLNIPRSNVKITAGSGRSLHANLPINPFIRGQSTGIILVPTDILRDLPVAIDWEGVSDAAAQNDSIRFQVNQQIGDIWHSKTLKQKSQLREWVLSNRENFESFLELLKQADKTPYDFVNDPKGEIFWRNILEKLAQEEPFPISQPNNLDFNGVKEVTEQIIEQFRFLIEDRRFSEELYTHQNGTPRPEKSAQRLFFAVAHAYCKANNIDITPEADTGNGPVDFKLSQGYRGRVLVEIKLSTNTKVTSGYTKQLETYAIAEEPIAAHYLVIDVGSMGNKKQTLERIHSKRINAGENIKHLKFIDGLRRASASHL
jgi:hypothetical protein